MARSLLACFCAATMLAVAGVGNPPALGAEPAAAVAERPNIVVVMTDDQTVESIRVMEQTRTLLGDQGTTFANSFVNFPLCCPSRATFFTGQYAHNHGIVDNVPPEGGFAKFHTDHGDDNLAIWLQDAGYHTTHVGKYMPGYGSTDPNLVPAGWSEWYATRGQSVYDHVVVENGTVVNYGETEADFKQDVITNRVVDVIDRRAPDPEPFFLSVMYTAPHRGTPDPSPQPPADCEGAAKPAPRHANAFDAEPLPQPPNFNEADVSDKPPSIQALPALEAADVDDVERKYRCGLESLLSVDEGVSRIVAALSDAGELGRTLIIFSSDNGFFRGEHRIPQGKNRHYEESSRVPLIIRGPGVVADATARDFVVNADLAATILDAADADAGLELDGVSLLPITSGGSFELDRDLLIEGRHLDYGAIRTDRYKYVEHTGGDDAGARELYDLVADPYELQSLHGDAAYSGLQDALAERLAALRTCAGASCRRAPVVAPLGTIPPVPTRSPPPDTEVAGEASARKIQRQSGRRIRVKVRVKAEERLAADARGAIKLKGRSYRFRPKTKRLSSGQRKGLTLRPRRTKHERKIASALRRGRTARAKITVKLTDEAGNGASHGLSVRVKR